MANVTGTKLSVTDRDRWERLGTAVPIIGHIARSAGLRQMSGLDDLDATTVRFRHMNLVRSWLGVTAFDREARRAIT